MILKGFKHTRKNVWKNKRKCETLRVVVLTKTSSDLLHRVCRHNPRSHLYFRQCKVDKQLKKHEKILVVFFCIPPEDCYCQFFPRKTFQDLSGVMGYVFHFWKYATCERLSTHFCHKQAGYKNIALKSGADFKQATVSTRSVKAQWNSVLWLSALRKFCCGLGHVPSPVITGKMTPVL